MLAERPTSDQSYQTGYKNGYIAAFVDAESEFSVCVKWQDDLEFGVKLDPIFRVSQGLKRESVLHELRTYFDCGHVRAKSGAPNQKIYIVDSERELREKLVPKLDLNPPRLKFREYSGFREIVTGWRGRKGKQDTVKLIRTAYEISGEKGKRKHSLQETLDRIDSFSGRG